MLGSCCFYWFGSWYIEKVVPGDYGIPQLWNFLFPRAATSDRVRPSSFATPSIRLSSSAILHVDHFASRSEWIGQNDAVQLSDRHVLTNLGPNSLRERRGNRIRYPALLGDAPTSDWLLSTIRHSRRSPDDWRTVAILRRWCIQVKNGQFSRSTDQQRIRRRCQRSVSHRRSRSAEEESDDQCSIGKFQYSDQCPDDQYNERILHVSITIEKRSKASRDSQREERSATVSAPTSEVHHLPPPQWRRDETLRLTDRSRLLRSEFRTIEEIHLEIVRWWRLSLFIHSITMVIFPFLSHSLLSFSPFVDFFFSLLSHGNIPRTTWIIGFSLVPWISLWDMSRRWTFPWHIYGHHLFWNTSPAHILSKYSL